jgi:hypothetical protein
MPPLGPPSLDTARDGGSCARSVGRPQECRAGRGLVESAGGVVTAPHERPASRRPRPAMRTAPSPFERRPPRPRPPRPRPPARSSETSGFDNRWPGATISLATRCTATGTRDCSRRSPRFGIPPLAGCRRSAIPEDPTMDADTAPASDGSVTERPALGRPDGAPVDSPRRGEGPHPLRHRRSPRRSSTGGPGQARHEPGHLREPSGWHTREARRSPAATDPPRDVLAWAEGAGRGWPSSDSPRCWPLGTTVPTTCTPAVIHSRP